MYDKEKKYTKKTILRKESIEKITEEFEKELTEITTEFVNSLPEEMKE